MNALFFVMIIAIAGGAAISFQSLFSGFIGEKLGIIESIFIVHLGGLLLASVLLLAVGGGNVASWRSLPWYTLCAGFLGVIIVGSISYVVPRIGLASTLTITISIQLILGAIIDHFGVLQATHHTLDLSRAVGILVLLLGTWLVIRK
jgi:transporter family-2 protein